MTQHARLTISFLLCLSLILEQIAFAQAIDLSGYFASNTPAQAALRGDKFRPLHLRYISYDTQSSDFKLLIDKGDFFNSPTPKLPNSLNSSTPKLQEATQELMKYFFIGLALPNDKFWVNLRPDSPENILDHDLEKTDIGRIFLEADLQLKKDTSGFTSPQTPEGRQYWDKLYKRAGELFGTENITIPTITRPWIVPNEIIIREAPDSAYIYKATLKVMLEEDYIRSPGHQVTKSPNNQPLTSDYNFSDPRLKELNEYSTELIRETIIPKLTYEINTSKRYAHLRQVYYSLILAQWFKQKYGPGERDTGNGIRVTGNGVEGNPYIKLIDSGNLTSNLQPLTTNQPYSKESYFKQYQKSFKDGEYNLSEQVSATQGQSIRRYVSGGMAVAGAYSQTRENNGVFTNSPLNSAGLPIKSDKLIPASYKQSPVIPLPFSGSLKLGLPSPATSPVSGNSSTDTPKRIIDLIHQDGIFAPSPAQMEVLLSFLDMIEPGEDPFMITAQAIDTALWRLPGFGLNSRQLTTVFNALSKVLRTKEYLGLKFLISIIDQSLSGNYRIRLDNEKLGVLIEALSLRDISEHARLTISSSIGSILRNNPGLFSSALMHITKHINAARLGYFGRVGLIDALNLFMQQFDYRLSKDIFPYLLNVNDDSRTDIFEKIIEPLFLSNPSLFDEDIIGKLKAVYEQDSAAFKYLLAYAAMQNIYPAQDVAGLFPYRKIFKEMMSGKRRVLVVQNIADGQGDELVRNSTLIQALLDFNPELEVVIYTARQYLNGAYVDETGHVVPAHPRIKEVKDIIDLVPAEAAGFDMVIHHYYGDMCYKNNVSEELDRICTADYAKGRIYIKTTEDDDWFNYEKVIIGGESLSLPRNTGNVYIPAYRLCAELGLPLRLGMGQSPGSGGSLFTAVANPYAENYWKDNVLPKAKGRKVVVFNGFGGESELKGYENSEKGRADFASALQEIISQGFFVLLLLNERPWGKREIAENVLKMIYPEGENDKNNDSVLIAPSLYPSGRETRKYIKDEQMPFLYKYLCDYADAVMTVEGGLMHLAFNMGRPFAVIHMSGAGKLSKWAPAAMDHSRQSIIRRGDNIAAVLKAVTGPEASSGLADKKESSSPAVDSNSQGGINLSRLPIVGEAASSAFGLYDMPLAALNVNPDEERLRMDDMLKSGIIPSRDRIAVYAYFCEDTGAVFTLFADAFRLQEEQLSAASGELKELLRMFETGNPYGRLELVL